MDVKDAVIHSRTSEVKLVERNGERSVSQVPTLVKSVDPLFDERDLTVLTVAWREAHVDSRVDRTVQVC